MGEQRGVPPSVPAFQLEDKLLPEDWIYAWVKTVYHWNKRNGEHAGIEARDNSGSTYSTGLNIEFRISLEFVALVVIPLI